MDPRIEDLFPLYALGALNDEERAQVDDYIAANPDAQARLTEVMRSASALPYVVTPIALPPRVKSAVIDRVRADARSRFAPRASRLSRLRAVRFGSPQRFGAAMPLLAGAGVLVAVLAGAWALTLNAEVVRLREEAAALRRELFAQSQAIAQIALPSVRAMAISGTEQQPGARGQLLADPRGNSAVLVVSGLASLRPGQVYQFWLIRGSTPVGAGIFRVDEQGRAVLPITSAESVGTFDAMGVSIEPEGGSPKPTGDIVMLSKLS